MAVKAAQHRSHRCHICFQSWLINKHFYKYGCLPLGDLLLHLFSLFCPSQNKELYYYVKLCLWKQKSAPLLRSPSPGKHDSTSHSPRSAWKTVFIEARCVPTSCLIMFPDRIPQPDHNTLSSSPNAEINMICFAYCLRKWKIRMEIRKRASLLKECPLQFLYWVSFNHLHYRVNTNGGSST